MNKNNIITTGVLFILILVLGYALMVTNFNNFKWSEFGDSFGFLNTLFSGLAFLTVAYSISQQNKSIELQNTSIEQQNILIEQQNMSIEHQQKTLELTIGEMKLQVEEMVETRKELKRQAIAQEKSENIARTSAMINAYSTLITKNYSHISELSEELKTMEASLSPYENRKNHIQQIDYLNEQIGTLTGRIEALLNSLEEYEH